MQHARYRLSLLVLVMILALAGCGGAQPTPTTQSQTSTGSFKVAMVFRNSIQRDAIGYEGLKLIEKELGAQIAYTDKLVEAEDPQQIEAFRTYAKEGYNLIIGYGGGFEDQVEVVAKEYPRVKFAMANSEDPGNNVNAGSLGMRNSETAYLAGMAAGFKTKTNKIGMIVGMQNEADTVAPSFEQGVKVANPAATVTVSAVGDWGDAEGALKLAQDQIKAQMDVIYIDTGRGDDAILEEAHKAGIFIIMGDHEETEVDTAGTLLTGVQQKADKLLLEAATLVQQGRWEGKLYRFGMREGILDLLPFNGMLTPEQEAEITKAKDKIISGELVLAS
jgi:basic membrane protein A and related proteins